MAKHHFQSSKHRGFYSLVIVTAVMGMGTVGMRAFEGYSWVDAFYFMSMLATAQGSAVTPATTGGKLFAAFMAFVSVGMVITTFGFLFGPFLGRLWHVGKIKFEEELRLLDHHKDDHK